MEVEKVTPSYALLHATRTRTLHCLHAPPICGMRLRVYGAARATTAVT